MAMDDERREASPEIISITADVKDIRKILIGNGNIETGMLYILTRLNEEFEKHLQLHERADNRKYAVLEKVATYIITFIIGGIITWFLTKGV